MGPVTRVRAARRAARSPQAAPAKTATTRRNSCRPEGLAGGTRYRISSADTPKPAFPTYRTVSRNCPPMQIILPAADRIRIYRAPRNSTADMPVRLRSGFRCHDTLWAFPMFITDDNDDEDVGRSMYCFYEQSRMFFGLRCRIYRLTCINDESNIRFIVC